MFVCTAMKDVVRKHRPSAPPVLRLEVRSADEFSLPSTHAVAIASTFVPLLMVYHSRYPVRNELDVKVSLRNNENGFV